MREIYTTDNQLNLHINSMQQYAIDIKTTCKNYKITMRY